ncbi:MAG: ankyrin repeat domain-containing protein [Chitinophagales bacterium]
MNDLEQLSADLIILILLNDLEKIAKITNPDIINHPDVFGRYPLLVACERGRFEAVELLAKTGVNTDIQNEKGQTPLMIAAAWGHEAIVDYLLYRFVDVELTNIEGKTAYDYAKKYHHSSIMKKLLQRTKLVQKQRAIHKKVTEELKDTPKRLTAIEDETGEIQYFRALQTAIMKKDDVALDSLLMRKVKWIWQKHKISYPLRTAIEQNNYYAFRKLIEKGYKPNCTKLRAEPIALCVKYNAYDLLQYALAEELIDPNTYCMRQDVTPLGEAVIRRNLALLKLLLEYGAYPIQKTSTGWDILDLASLPEMVELLIEYREKLK